MAKKQCEAMIFENWHSHQCRNNANMEFEGKHYCGIHNPIKRKEKEKIATQKYKEEDEAKEYKLLANGYCKKKGLTLQQLRGDYLSELNEGGENGK